MTKRDPWCQNDGKANTINKSGESGEKKNQSATHIAGVENLPHVHDRVAVLQRRVPVGRRPLPQIGEGAIAIVRLLIALEIDRVRVETNRIGNLEGAAGVRIADGKTEKENEDGM